MANVYSAVVYTADQYRKVLRTDKKLCWRVVGEGYNGTAGTGRGTGDKQRFKSGVALGFLEVLSIRFS